MKLQNKVAIITGAAGGIGFATARRFLQEGAVVAICDTDQSRVDAAVARLSEFGEVFGAVTDVTVRRETDELAAKVVERCGKIDVLINNAGITADAQFYKMPDEDFYRVITVNLFGTYNMSKAVVPYMMERHYGKIVNAASTSAIKGNFGQCNYAASKAAIIAFTRSLGHELGKYGINVNCVTPGFVRTGMTAKMPPAEMEKRVASIPLRRPGEVEDIAAMYAFLASDEASYVTATTIIADGGMH